MPSKRNTDVFIENDYDFRALNYTRSWVIAGFIILAIAIGLAAASIALPTFVMISPSVFDASSANLNKARSLGYTQVCFTSDNTCQYRDPSYVDGYSGLMTNLRLAELAMHAIAIIIMCICFIAALALIIIWYKQNIDNKCFRNWRLIIGIFLMLAGLCLQSSIIMFHVEQFQDKYDKSSGHPYGFNQWSEQQRTTTSITYGSGYILLWLATIFCFISAWIFLGTYCCWTLDDVDADEDTHQQPLPRYSTESGNINRRGSSIIYSDN
ncbi:hypothetical protein MN116_007874 [Schistosoma mekongi]|uniref:Uncharacterized protein n=1 Tax=Schistosoma mekongi TaxID=38744 RepID=A0AAE1Z7D2_SCHME|nr:hypothetical protein MN116_007874 [Schistosoma mekongi]